MKNGDREFEAGDIVRLAWGSIEMTVESVKNDECKCIWLVNGEPREVKFPAIVLEFANSNELRREET